MSRHWAHATLVAIALAAPVALQAAPEVSYAPPGYSAPPTGYTYVKDSGNDRWVLVAIAALAAGGAAYAIFHHDGHKVPYSPPTGSP